MADDTDIDALRKALGRDLALYRAEAQLTQHDLASKVNYARSTIANVEVGRQPAPHDFWQRCDDALRANGQLVAAYQRLEARRLHLRRYPRDTRGQSAPESPTAATGQLPRRDLLAAAASTAVLQLGALGDQIGSHLGMTEVRDMRRRTSRLRRLDNYLGGADTMHRFNDEMRRTETISRTAQFTESVGSELLALLAEQAQLAGWAAFDGGDLAYAENLYLMSREVAIQAESQVLAANAYALLAYQRASIGQPDVALAEASATELNSATPPPVRALLLERLAFTYAVDGRSAHAERALAQAEEALTAQPAMESPDWAAWVDNDEIRIMTGRVWAELGRPLRAIPPLTRALNNFDDTYARDKALYLTWLAQAYSDVREPEKANDILRTAVRLADGIASPRPYARVTAVHQRLCASK